MRSQRPKRQTVLAGHGDVEDGKVEGLGLEQAAHCGGVFGGRYVIAVGAEILGDRVPKVGLVLNDDDPARQCNHASAIGRK